MHTARRGLAAAVGPLLGRADNAEHEEQHARIRREGGSRDPGDGLRHSQPLAGRPKLPYLLVACRGVRTVERKEGMNDELLIDNFNAHDYLRIAGKVIQVTPPRCSRCRA